MRKSSLTTLAICATLSATVRNQGEPALISDDYNGIL